MWRPDSVYDDGGHLDEGVVHAWLDDALDPAAAAEVQAHVAACEVCATRVAEARGLIAGASRLLGALDVASVTASVTPSVAAGGRAAPAAIRPATPRAARPRWSTRRVGAAAAAVLVFVAGSVLLRDRFAGADAVRDSIGVTAEAPRVERSERGYSVVAAPPGPAPVPAAPATADRQTDAGAAEAPAARAGAGVTALRGVQPASADPAPVSSASAPRRAAPVPSTSAPAPAPFPPAVVAAPDLARPRTETAALAAGRQTAPAAAERALQDSAAAAAARDSVLARWRRSRVRLEEVVVTGAAQKGAERAGAAAASVPADPAAPTRGAWVVGCWQVSDTELLVEFTGASLSAPVAELSEAWHPGARIAAGQWSSIAWRFGRDSSVRVREWEPGRDLVVRPGSDAAAGAIVERGEAVRRVLLVRRGASCP